MESQKRRFFVHMAVSAYQVISKKVKYHMVTIAMLDTHECINNLYWQSSGVMIFLCKYYINTSDTLVPS